MKIAVVGTGYVGLVSGTCFAESGNQVTCVDIDAAKVEKMKNGYVPIYEPGLEILFERNTKAGRLHFTTDLTEGIKDAKIIFLALPTPPGADGSADLSFVLKVAKDLSEIIKDYKVIVDKSTVPVGTAERVEAVLLEKLDQSLFDVVSNPEFLREGVAVEDFMKPDRVVVGTSSEKAKKVMSALYEPFVRQGNPIIFMDERSAEMTKYAANSYLATRISFMNEVANLCEAVGADVNNVRRGIGSDQRIGQSFLFPGVGYGGSCFPKDVRALLRTSEEYKSPLQIIAAVDRVNHHQKQRLTAKVVEHFGGKDKIKGKVFALWGLAFKPKTDDMREAPSLTVIKELTELGATFKAYDPEANHTAKRALKDFESKVTFVESSYDALEDSDALLIVTEWSEFRRPNFGKISSLLKQPVVFDGRNLFEPTTMKRLGFSYYSIGRLPVIKEAN